MSVCRPRGRYYTPYAEIDEADDALAIQEKISANLEGGSLTLTLPKAKAAHPRKIAVG